MRGAEGELRRVAEAALTIKPNFGYTLKEVKDDIQRVFDTGFFDKCQPHGEDTRDGIKLIVEVHEQAPAAVPTCCPHAVSCASLGQETGNSSECGPHCLCRRLQLRAVPTTMQRGVHSTRDVMPASCVARVCGAG